MSSILIREMFGLPQVFGDVGIECEVEATGRFPQNVGGWQIHAEDSLRGNGIEYVTHGPRRIGEVEQVLSNLFVLLNKPEVNVRESANTSTHVHLNLCENTATQYWNTAFALWMLDDLLMESCGKDRCHNNFCLRFGDSQGIVKQVAYDLKRDVPFLYLTQDRVKYGSVNVGNASTRGTIEQRGQKGSTDTKYVTRWVNNLWQVKTRAVQFDTPATLMDFFYNTEPKAILQHFLQDDLVDELIKYKDWDKRVKVNMGALCELSYGFDWIRWQAKLDKMKRPKLKEQPAQPQLDPFPGNWAMPRVEMHEGAPRPAAVRPRAIDRILGR